MPLTNDTAKREAELERWLEEICAARPGFAAILEGRIDSNARLNAVLRRAGFEGEVTWRMLMKAWKSVGLPPGAFGRAFDGDLIEVLEAKASVLDRIRGGFPTDGVDPIDLAAVPLSESLRKKTGIIRGRPKGTRGDGKDI